MTYDANYHARQAIADMKEAIQSTYPTTPDLCDRHEWRYVDHCAACQGSGSSLRRVPAFMPCALCKGSGLASFGTMRCKECGRLKCSDDDCQLEAVEQDMCQGHWDAVCAEHSDVEG